MIYCLILAALLVAAYFVHGTAWGCRWMAWHIPTDAVGFDGCSNTSTCCHCGKSILQDSQGGWFVVGRHTPLVRVPLTYQVPK